MDVGRRRSPRTASVFLVTAVMVTTSMVATGFTPAASAAEGIGPTNGQIAFVSTRDFDAFGDTEIYVMNADGSGQTRLTNAAGTQQCPSWSPDGTRIAFCSTQHTLDINKAEIYVMNADGSGQARLTTNDAHDAWPAWSPDGTQIAFVSYRDGSYGDGSALGEIYVMNADGTSQTEITTNDAIEDYPAWSPDGTQIAFVSTRDGNYEIYVMDADGANQTRLTTSDRKEDRPAWSPDGTKIAFQSGAIYVMDADGANQTSLPGTYGDVSPAWSPDGTQIAVASYVYSESWGWEISTMNADGSGRYNRTNAPLHDFQPAWGAISVAYDFAGFFQPVDNVGWNIAKAGSAIPVKFSLGGDQGLSIFRDGYPKATYIACDTAVAAGDVIEEVVTAGGSILAYNAVTDQYTYVWKTSKLWATKCVRFDVTLIDGTSHTFEIAFKK